MLDKQQESLGEQSKPQPVTHTEKLCVTVFASLATVLLLQVSSRYLFNNAIGWTEEAARYLLVILSLLGISLVFKRNTHIRFTFFLRFIPNRLSHWHDVMVSFTNTGFILFLLLSAFSIAPLLVSHQMSSIDISISDFYYVITLVLFLCLVSAIRFFISLIRRKG